MSEYTVTPGAFVRLQRNLFSRMRCRPYYSPDDYCRVFSEHEGQVVPSPARFIGPGGVSAYNVTLSGKIYHCPALYADEVEATT